MILRIETDLWAALSEQDKISRSGVRYRPVVEYEDDEAYPLVPTGYMVMAHPLIDEHDEVMAALKGMMS